MPLPLETYRHLIALDEPFAPAVAETRAPAPLLRVALDFLEAEAEQPSDAHGDASRLRALLTLRSPAPLPAAVQAAIDTWLQLERAAWPLVAAAELPRFALPNSEARCQFALWQGDITTLRADAIVNAANERLLGCFTPFHACIDNAIHTAAGPRLREDCQRIMRAQRGLEPTACAKITRGYHLPSRFVLHTVGPIVRGSLTREHEAALARCYRACLDLALETGMVRSLAFCAISTGVFGFPREPAARIALRAARAWVLEHPHALDLIVFNVFSEADRQTYERAIAEFEP